MACRGSNRPFVVWAACFLWLTSMFAITWSLVLFLCVGDMLLLTGTDLINAFVLLSGLMLLPTNMHMIYSIANCKKIDHRSKVACCPLWMCIVWVVIINLGGVFVCIQKILCCKKSTEQYLEDSMRRYRSIPKYKHFMDNLQWSLKCCGLNSYRDWFSRDWYDKIRDYEWDPSANRRNLHHKRQIMENDSVPLSCCKSGSCISNYLSELGTYSINTNGCSPTIYRLIMVSMVGHLFFFSLIVMVELILLKCIITKKSKDWPAHDFMNETSNEVYNVRQILKAKDNFDASSGSYQMNPEDSDDIESTRQFTGQNQVKGEYSRNT